MGFPYFYKKGPNTLGIGVENFALEQPHFDPVASTYGPRYNVRSCLAPLHGASQFPIVQSGPDVSLRANGVYLSGDLALAALTEFDKGRS